MAKLQRKDKLVPNRQNNDLWVKMPSPDIEIDQGQNFNEQRIVQNEYLKNLETNENIEQIYRQDRLGNDDYGQ